ncbi:MAG: hypothetical protein HQ555_09590 [Candidatus Aminicenantes bacterium]|nr:hypothetical protein [Candidatus Aminicenantes bacterium]
MKRWIWISLVISLILPLCGQDQRKEEIPPLAQEIANKISLALQKFEKGRATEGVPLLLDVILLTRPRSSWPDGFAGAIESAKDSFQNANYSEGTGYVKQAMGLFEPDKPRHIERNNGQISNIADTILNKIQSALEGFKTGNADQAVILILESLALLGPHKNQE